METYCIICKKNTANRILVSEQLKKIDQCLHQIVPYVAIKNQGLLKIKKRVDY